VELFVAAGQVLEQYRERFPHTPAPQG